MGSLSLPIGEGRAESGEACPGPDPGSGPLRAAIGVKSQPDTAPAPDTDGIAEKGGYSSYTHHRHQFWMIWRGRNRERRLRELLDHLTESDDS